MKLTVAQDFRSLVPPLTERETAELVDGLKAHAKAMPPILYWANGPKRDGHIIVDGMTRYTEASKRGVMLKCIGLDFDDREAAMNFTRTVQLARRNLTPSQYALLYAERNRHRQHGGDRRSKDFQGSEVNFEKPGKSLLAAANKVVGNGSAQLTKAVRQGEVKVSDAAAVTALPKSEQAAALRKVKSGVAKTLRGAISGGTSFDPQEIESASPRRNGSLVTDTRAFAKWEEMFGKFKRATDDLNRVCPGGKHAREIHNLLNSIFDLKTQWAKSIT